VISLVGRSPWCSLAIRAIRTERALRATTHARISKEMKPTPGGSAGGAAGGNKVISA